MQATLVSNETDPAQRKDVARELISDGLLCVEPRREKRLQKLVRCLDEISIFSKQSTKKYCCKFRWAIILLLKMPLKNVIWTYGDMVTSLKMMLMNLVWANVKIKSPCRFYQPHSTRLSRGVIVSKCLAEWSVTISRSSPSAVYYCFDFFFFSKMHLL